MVTLEMSLSGEGIFAGIRRSFNNRLISFEFMELACLTHQKCRRKIIIMRSGLESWKCPTCQERYRYDDLTWNTELLPCPFVQQKDFGCAIVVKPSIRSFLEYRAGDDLHIGISDSKSVVRSFWLNGISTEDRNWDGSLVIYRFGSENGRFDQSLSSFTSSYQQRFHSQFYDDVKWNCFDFVVEFMRALNLPNITKVSFVTDFVQNPLNNAIKYNALVRKAMQTGFISLQ